MGEEFLENITKVRKDFKYKAFIKKNYTNSSLNKPDIDYSEDSSFFSNGSLLEIYFTKIYLLHTDYFKFNISQEGVYSEEDTPHKTDTIEEYVDNRIKDTKSDWEFIENDDLNTLFKLIKDRFSFSNFKSKINISITLDQSIENFIINEDFFYWSLIKFKNISFKSYNINTNTIVFPSEVQIDLNSLTLEGFDIIINKLFIINCDNFLKINFSRIISSYSSNNESGTLTIQTKKLNLQSIEINGLLNILANGILDNENLFMENIVNINSLFYKISEKKKTKSKRNVIKLSDFYQVNINYISINKENENINYLNFIRCREVNISNYINKNINNEKSGSELYFEKSNRINLNNITINSSIENKNYYLALFSDMQEDASIYLTDSNIMNISLFDLLEESYGKVEISDCNINSQNFIKTSNVVIYNLNIDDSNINIENFNIDGINELTIYDSNLNISDSFKAIVQKMIIDDCSFYIEKELDVCIHGKIDLKSVTSSIINTSINCSKFNIHSIEGTNCNLKYEDFKLSCNNYEDKGFEKIILESKVILISSFYNFNSKLLKNNSKHGYIRCEKLSQTENSIIFNCGITGLIIFDLKNNNNNSIYLNFYYKELLNNTFNLLFEYNECSSNKNIYLNANNYFLDTIIESKNVSNININLSLNGENTFSGSRLFCKDNDNTIYVYKINKIDSSNLENIEYLETNKIPPKTITKLKYGVLKNANI